MKNSLASDSIKLSISKVVTTLIMMIVTMLLSRMSTLEEYGTYSQLLVVINLMISIISLGLPNSTNFFLTKAQTEEEKQHFLSVYYTLSTILGILSGLFLIMSIQLITLYFKNPLIKNFCFFLAIYPWTTIINSSIENVLIVYKKSTLLMWFLFFHSIFLVSNIFVSNLLGLAFQTYIFSYLCIEVIFTILVYIIINNIAGKIKFSVNISIIKSIFIFSIPIGLSTVVGTLKRDTDTLFIAYFYNSSDLAVFSNAARELPLSVIAGSLTAVLLPRLANLIRFEKMKEALNLWGETTKLSFVILCFCVTVLFVFAPEVITILYSEKYLAGVTVFRVYLLVLLFRCTYFGMIFNCIGKTKFILINSILAFVTNIFLNFIFYYLFGFVGPAIATLLATLLSAYILLFFTAKTIKTLLKDVFPWIAILKILLINIAFGFIFFVLKDLIYIGGNIGSILEFICLSLIWFVLYSIAFWKYIKKKWNILNSTE